MPYIVTYKYFDMDSNNNEFIGKCTSPHFKTFREASDFEDELRQEKYISGQCPYFDIKIKEFGGKNND